MDTMLKTFKTLVEVKDDTEDEVLTVYLNLAKQAVLNKLFPYGNGIEMIPRKYEANVLQIAVYLYNRQGSEGEISHSENGINRSYESANIPAAYFNDIVPMVGGF